MPGHSALAVASCSAGYSTPGRCARPVPSGYANVTGSIVRTIISGFVNFAISECKSVNCVLPGYCSSYSNTVVNYSNKTVTFI